MIHRIILIAVFVSQKIALSERPPLLFLQFDVQVRNRLVASHVTAVFSNLGRKHFEGKLQLPLPENAILSSLILTVDGRNFTSFVKKRKKKKDKSLKNNLNVVELHERSGKPQVISVTTFLSGFSELKLQFFYKELLQRRRGRYAVLFYLPKGAIHLLTINALIHEEENLRHMQFLFSNGEYQPLQKIARGNARINLPDKNQISLSYRRESSNNAIFSYEVSNKDIKLSESTDTVKFEPGSDSDLIFTDSAYVFFYDVERKADAGEIQIHNGYFVHFIAPEGLPKLPVHTVFVLDISGSMENLEKLRNLKLAMKSILTNLRQKDSFQMIVFSNYVRSLGVFNATRNGIDKGINKVGALRAYGGTNINDALLYAIEGAVKDSPLKNGAKQIVFLTDGKPSIGEKNPLEIRKNLKKSNKEKLSVYTLGFGDDADMRFLRQISSENGGFSRKIYSEGRASDQLKGFYEEISTPLLTDLSVIYGEEQVDDSTLMKTGQDDFYSGDEVIVAGKLREPSTAITPLVNGNGREGRVQLRLPRKHFLEDSATNVPGNVEVVWAYLAVRDFLFMQEIVENESVRKEMGARALDIALKYNFVTRVTSLGMLEDPGSLYQGRLDISSTGMESMSKEKLSLIPPEVLAATLPDEVLVSMPPAPNRRYSFFADNDPHFVVQVPGLKLPLCFDLHGQPGDVISLIKDEESGIIVNGEVSAAIDRPKATYFTRIYISLNRTEIYVTPHSIQMNCLEGEPIEISDIIHENVKKKIHNEESLRPKRQLRKKRQRKRGHRKSSREGRGHNDDKTPFIDVYYDNLNENKLRQEIFRVHNSETFSKTSPPPELNDVTPGKAKGKNSFKLSCPQNIIWNNLSRVSQGNVLLIVRGRRRRRRLDIIMGDVLLHVVIMNTRNRGGQSFLGFYIQYQTILSPGTSGVIGQFIYKSVGTAGYFPELSNEPEKQENRSIPLAVVHHNTYTNPRVTMVSSVVSKRRSLLHRTRVHCLHVKQHGKGLLAAPVEENFLQCISC